VISTDKNFSRCGSIPANGLQLAISLDPCKVSEVKQHFIVFQVPRKAKLKIFLSLTKFDPEKKKKIKTASRRKLVSRFDFSISPWKN